MIVYQNYITFTILGQEVILISDDTDYGRNTVAEVNDEYFYLGDETPDVAAAICAWSNINDRDLTEEELLLIMKDNHIISV